MTAVQPGPAVDARSRPRLLVDWTRCDGHGLCHTLAPDLVRRDEWGFPALIPTAGRPATMRQLRRVVAVCPALALRLEPS